AATTPQEGVMAASKHNPNRRALDAVARRARQNALVLVETREVRLPATGERITLFRAVSKADANGPSFITAFDAAGAELPAEGLPEVRAADAPVIFGAGSTAPGAAAPPVGVTINPTQNVFTLNSRETVSESIIVTIPKNAATKKADVYSLADNTGSMGSIINAVKAGAGTILSSLPAGIDFAVGVG